MGMGVPYQQLQSCYSLEFMQLDLPVPSGLKKWSVV